MFKPGREQTIQALGRTWKLSRLGPAAIERFCAWIRAQIGDPFAGLEQIIDKLPRAEATRLIDAAKQQKDALAHLDLTDPLIASFSFGRAAVVDAQGGVIEQAIPAHTLGSLHLFAVLLEKYQPGADIDDAAAIIGELGPEALQQLVATASGQAEGNGSVPPCSRAGPPTLGPTGMKSAADSCISAT